MSNNLSCIVNCSDISAHARVSSTNEAISALVDDDDDDDNYYRSGNDFYLFYSFSPVARIVYYKDNALVKYGVHILS